MKKILLFVLLLVTLSSCGFLFLGMPAGIDILFDENTPSYSTLFKGRYECQANDLTWKLDINELKNYTKFPVGIGTLTIYDEQDSTSLDFRVEIFTELRSRVQYVDVFDTLNDKRVAYFENAVYWGDSIILLNSKFDCDSLTNFQNEVGIVDVEINKLRELENKIRTELSEEDKAKDDMLINISTEKSILSKKRKNLEAKLQQNKYICFEPTFKNRIPYRLVFKKQYSYPRSELENNF